MNNEEWKECADLISDEEQKIGNDINWTCLCENSSLPIPDKNYDSALNEIADRAFLTTYYGIRTNTAMSISTFQLIPDPLHLNLMGFAWITELKKVSQGLKPSKVLH